MFDSTYVIAGPDIVFEDFGGDLVVLNIATGQYFGFNATAAKLWQALMAGVRPTTLFAARVAPEAMRGFLERLTECGLVTPSDRAESPLADHLRSALMANPTPPTVDVYEDLADLIVADPIHDAETGEGWPRISKAA